MKINLNWNLKGLDGKEITQGANAGKNLANALASQNTGNSIKLYDWSLKLWNGTALEIDDTDTEVLISLVEANQMLTVLGKAQIIEHIKKIKDKK